MRIARRSIFVRGGRVRARLPADVTMVVIGADGTRRAYGPGGVHRLRLSRARQVALFAPKRGSAGLVVLADIVGESI